MIVKDHNLSKQEDLDPTEQALLAEFGVYLQQIALTFTKPIEASIRAAEQDMLKRLQAHEAAIVANHAADANAVQKRHAELQQLSSEFTVFLKQWHHSLTTTESEFRQFMRSEEERLKLAEQASRDELTRSLSSVLEQRLSKLQVHTSDTAAQAQSLQRKVGTLTSRTNFILGLVIFLLVVLPILMVLTRH